MSNHRRIAVIDVGKTNAKLVVVDAATGTEVASRSTPNSVVEEGPYPHYDVEALWGFFIESLAGFARSPGFDAISVTAHGASAALLGENGLAMPVIDYEYNYPDEVRAAYKALRPDFSETRSPFLSGGLNVGAQIHYQKTQFPEQFGKVRTIVTYAQYWVWRLSGVAVNEVTSLGCHTDLWNPELGEYSSLVDRLGLRPLMAPTRSAFDKIGDLRLPLARQIGIDEAVPVYCGIHDSNATLLPHLISRKSPFQLSRPEPGSCLLPLVEGSTISTRTGHACQCRRLWQGGAVGTIHGRTRIRSLDRWQSRFEPDAEALDRVIRDQFMILPSVVQGSGPYPAREAILLNGKSRSDAEQSAAASLYTALMTNTCLELIGASGPTIVEGPFSRNRTYLSALKSLTGRDVIALPGSTGTSLGAAMLAGAECSIEPAIEEVVPLGDAFDVYAQNWLANLRSE